MKTHSSRVADLLKIFLAFGFFLSCGDGDFGVFVSDNFDSGSLGSSTQLARCEFDFSLQSDNGNPTLPTSFRNWWYVKLDGVPQKESCQFTISNRGWPFRYTPVFSYDNIHWQRVSESSLSQGCREGPNRCLLKFQTSFQQSTVYLARYYPYPYERLQAYLATLEYPAQIEILGDTLEGRPIPMLRLGPEHSEKAVWIHARTHPAETAGSFVIEGVVEALLSLPTADRAYYIVPMHNIDGVVEGNYRTDTQSRNLETRFSDSSTIAEIVALREQMRLVAERHSQILALNLHSSNSLPEQASYGIVHFFDSLDPEESVLFENTVQFLELLREESELPIDELLTRDEFLSEDFPETWWWLNYGSRVTALTLETTYETAGLDRVATDADMRALGSSLVEAISQL